MKKIGLAAIAAISLTACSKVETPEVFNELQGEVTEALDMMSHLDSASIAEQYNKVKPYFEYLSSTEFDSTRKDIYIKDLTWLDRYQRAIYKWKGQSASNLAKLQESASQLNDLSHDIIYDKVDTAQLRNFIRQERFAIEGVLRSVHERGGEILYYGEGVDSMLTRLDSLLPDVQ